MDTLKPWEVKNEVGIFKIDLKKVSFASKGHSSLEFKDFYYHDKSDSPCYCFNISTKFIIKDIAIYLADNGQKIILCFQNNKNFVKFFAIKGHYCNDITIEKLKNTDLQSMQIKIVKIFDNFKPFKVNKIGGRI